MPARADHEQRRRRRRADRRGPRRGRRARRRHAPADRGGRRVQHDRRQPLLRRQARPGHGDLRRGRRPRHVPAGRRRRRRGTAARGARGAAAAGRRTASATGGCCSPSSASRPPTPSWRRSSVRAPPQRARRIEAEPCLTEQQAGPAPGGPRSRRGRRGSCCRSPSAPACRRCSTPRRGRRSGCAPRWPRPSPRSGSPAQGPTRLSARRRRPHRCRSGARDQRLERLAAVSDRACPRVLAVRVPRRQAGDVRPRRKGPGPAARHGRRPPATVGEDRSALRRHRRIVSRRR